LETYRSAFEVLEGFRREHYEALQWVRVIARGVPTLTGDNIVVVLDERTVLEVPVDVFVRLPEIWIIGTLKENSIKIDNIYEKFLH
jgi:hypothetical protein